MPRIDWKKYDHLLGTMPDSALARQIGCTVMSVAKRRQVRGVRSWMWTRIAEQVKQQAKDDDWSAIEEDNVKP